jgi:hypothetical protein
MNAARLRAFIFMYFVKAEKIGLESAELITSRFTEMAKNSTMP